METVLEIDPLTEFFSAIRNANTKRNYEKDLAKFFDYLKLEGSLKEQARVFAKRARSDNQWATYQMNSYIQMQKERVERKEITESRIHNLYKPIRLFCEENDILLNWKKLGRRIPRRAKAANDRAPEPEEIKKILSYPDRRIKPAALIMESCGCRIGAFDYLNWGNIEPIEKNRVMVAARIKIYDGTNEEYASFLTPEAFLAVKEYIDYRKDEGEKITKDSPVIRDLIIGDRWGKARPQEVTRLKSTGIKRLVEDALKVMGIRGKLAKGKRRHEFQADHGFRKYFKSVCERKMKSLHVEMLLGHTVGLADNYYRPQESELLEEYLKAVPDLTILNKPPPVQSEQVEDLQKRVETLEQELKDYRSVLQETVSELKRFKVLKKQEHVIGEKDVLPA
jgi:integrase